MNLENLAKECGVTYRQAHYCLLRKYIPGVTLQGSGKTILFEGRAEEQFRIWARLVVAGVQPHYAAQLSAEALDHPGWVDLKGDVRILFGAHGPRFIPLEEVKRGASQHDRPVEAANS